MDHLMPWMEGSSSRSIHIGLEGGDLLHASQGEKDQSRIKASNDRARQRELRPSHYGHNELKLAGPFFSQAVFDYGSFIYCFLILS